MARPLVPLVGALLVAALAGCGGGGEEDRVVALGEDRPSFERAGWRTDFSRRSVPLEEIHTGGPLRDGVPPIDEPRAVGRTAAEPFLSERDPVLAVVVGGTARAYPVRTLVWHEIVNDSLNGRPIAVTYSPLSNSSLVFDRRVGGRVRSFGTTGNLRRSNLVMWDRESESWWQQLTARAIVGELAGTSLPPLPAQTLSWAGFKRRHPRGDVLSRDTGASRDYASNPYLGYDRPLTRPHLFRGRVDPRLAPKERVVALLDAAPPIAVAFRRLQRERVVEAGVGATPVVVIYGRGVASAIDADSTERSKDVGTAGVFDRRVGARRLSFVSRRGAVVDRETGSEWDVTGRAVSGRLRGTRLRPLRHDQPFWFALAAFAPETRIALGAGAGRTIGG
jgi:hypothetical protein